MKLLCCCSVGASGRGILQGRLWVTLPLSLWCVGRCWLGRMFVSHPSSCGMASFRLVGNDPLPMYPICCAVRKLYVNEFYLDTPWISTLQIIGKITPKMVQDMAKRVSPSWVINSYFCGPKNRSCSDCVVDGAAHLIPDVVATRGSLYTRSTWGHKDTAQGALTTNSSRRNNNWVVNAWC